jgi:hypothetical protein
MREILKQAFLPLWYGIRDPWTWVLSFVTAVVVIGLLAWFSWLLHL